MLLFDIMNTRKASDLLYEGCKPDTSTAEAEQDTEKATKMENFYKFLLELVKKRKRSMEMELEIIPDDLIRLEMALEDMLNIINRKPSEDISNLSHAEKLMIAMKLAGDVIPTYSVIVDTLFSGIPEDF